MAGHCSCCVSLEKVEEDLTAYGMNLMNLPSATDELLKLLEKVESLLKLVGQHPVGSTRSALQPVMKALVRNEFLRHTNEDVKVSVVSCITEISRIFAPKYPYDDHKQMEEIFQQTIMALKKLSDVSSCSYRKVVRILEIFAKVRTCVLLLDLENETLVIEIFKLFLEVIRPYHPRNIFTWMKEIMTRLIEGSEELSVELLRPLLDSLKIDNQMASPVASKLGENVLKDCAAIVKPYFAEALKSMSLDSDYYAEIGSLLCNELPKGKEMDSKRARTSKDHGAELIGAKIKVWCPLEQAFYEGVISSFDSETNKHEVVYDDSEVEKLKLHEERWEMLEDNSSQKDSKRPCTIKEYGKELVGARIKVWWPFEEKFYEGVVSSFDPVKMKHKVVYDDGQVEKLRLHRERWEMLEDNSSQKDHELDFQGHAVSSATSSKKKANSNSSTGPNISSSKRS
ncbi:sister chromatid cohesion protein PDS5 homolog C-like isoform X2 [Solanum dulcamara]|uniref:sister chromatid cohesion protein PDS5 homolog C-like isoform X2 n=2 Tax=Solanum dulcamara TaxID=45834 RepID=UPI002486700D|nr:sister chromatid cohesion protein PDS5 homolog C-like isoform X2 [Solanum dulcamara]